MTRKLAIITGATSGIGAAFAEKYADLGYDLMLTGRRESIINALADKLREKHGVKVEVIIAELTDKKSLDLLINKIENLDNLFVLVNNAAFGGKKKFYDDSIEVPENMIKLHVLAVIKLVYAALPKMMQRKEGTIINVSSAGAFMPFPYSAVYVATKAFISLFTETLRLELVNTGIKIQTLCPGLTRTDFFKKLGVKNTDDVLIGRSWLWTLMKPEDVVSRSLRDLQRGKSVCVPGFLNKLLATKKILENIGRIF